jgi:uncharacterized tellurite resistance protein B-like protein
MLSGSPPRGEADDLRIAVAALLVEAAWSADGFQAEERAMIARLLQDRFALTAQETDQLIDSGDKAGRETVNMLRFTKRVLEGMEPAQRVEMIEMLWDVAYADGHLDPEEELLITKVAGLLFVSPGERNAAKRRAMARANIG